MRAKIKRTNFLHQCNQHVLATKYNFYFIENNSANIFLQINCIATILLLLCHSYVKVLAARGIKI